MYNITVLILTPKQLCINRCFYPPRIPSLLERGMQAYKLYSLHSLIFTPSSWTEARHSFHVFVFHPPVHQRSMYSIISVYICVYVIFFFVNHVIIMCTQDLWICPVCEKEAILGKILAFRPISPQQEEEKTRLLQAWAQEVLVILAVMVIVVVVVLPVLVVVVVVVVL